MGRDKLPGKPLFSEFGVAEGKAGLEILMYLVDGVNVVHTQEEVLY